MADAQRRVFISYARADSTAFVDRLEQDLKARQFQPWVDRHGLEGGEEWMETIQQSIDECQALVVVLSPGAVQSRFVRMEYRYASEISKLVIPLRYLATPTTPMDLRILQWVDFQSSYEAGLRKLMQALSRLKVSAPPLAPTQDMPPKTKEQMLTSPAKPAEPKAKPSPAPATPSKTKKQWLDEGNAHFNAKRYTQALAAYDQAIKLDPQFALAHFGRGNVLDELKRYPEALAAYDQAIQFGYEDASVYFNKVLPLYRLKRYKEALAACDRAIQLDPQSAAAYNRRGATLRKLQRDAEALAAYDQAIKLNPQFALAYNNKALLLVELGREREALKTRKKARVLGYTG